MAVETTKYLSGWRTPAAPGIPAVYYNSSQQKLANTGLCNALGDPKNQKVCVTPYWHQIWWSHHLLRLAGEFGAVWNARPGLPGQIETQLGGLNMYESNMPEVQSGGKFQIEISSNDQDLIPCISFLMGANHNTVMLDMGENGGNARIAHHLEHRMGVKPYDIYVRDLQQQLPPAYADGAALDFPGLPAGTVVINDNFPGFDEAIIRRSMLALCDSGPVADECESAWISNSVGVFAECYRGVAQNENAGRDGNRPGIDGFVRGGDVEVPAGSFICNMFTPITKDGIMANMCRDRVVKLVQLSSNLANIRYSIEPLLLAFQHAARQIGLNAMMMFQSTTTAAMVAPSTVLPDNADEIKARVFEGTATAGDNEPSALMYMTSLITGRFYNCKLPNAIMFYGVGDNHHDNGTPFENNDDHGATRGMCLVSVHPAQLKTAMFSGNCSGMVGIPADLGDQASELTFTMARSGSVFAVKGAPGSYENADNEAEFDNGVGMLGHSVILRRDSNVVDPGDYRIVMTSVKRKGEVGSSVMMELEQMPRVIPRAFVPTTNNMSGGWNAALNICHAHMELYSDFDYFSSKELNLGLSQADNGEMVATNGVYRGRLPGYVAIAIASGVPSGPRGATGVFKMPGRKKLRTSSASAAESAQHGVDAAMHGSAADGGEGQQT
jgi:hypothetical protein